MAAHYQSDYNKPLSGFRRYIIAMCSVLILLPLLISGWAYNHISLASDDWLIFGYGLRGITQDVTDSQRPLLQPAFTLLTQLSGGNFDVLMLVNLWVFPALASTILFLALIPFFQRWFEWHQAAFIAFIVVVLCFLHPANSSRPWLTMIAYHLTHILFFGVFWCWIHGIRQRQGIWIMLAVILMTINQLMVETQSFLYLLMPMLLLWGWSSLRRIPLQWWAMAVVWYGAWLAYMVWRVFLSDGALRGAELPTPIGGMVFMVGNFIHGYRLAIQNSIDSALELLQFSPLMLTYVAVLAAGIAVFLGWAFNYQRKLSLSETGVKLTRFNRIALIYAGIGVTAASLAPYLLYLGENFLLFSVGIDSRMFQMVVVGLSFLTVVALLFEQRLHILFVFSILFIIGGVTHQVRLTYDYIQANDFQHTFWSQLLSLPLKDVEFVIALVDEHYGMARIDGQSWGMTSGLVLMGKKDTPPMYNLNQLRQIRVEGDRLHVIAQRENTQFSYDVALSNVRVIQADDDGFLQVVPVFRFIPRGGESNTIHLYTGFNRPTLNQPDLTDLGRWYFSQPHTITACWTEVAVTTPDSAPSSGVVTLTDTATQQVIDRRAVEQGEPLDYVAQVACSQSLQADFLSDTPDGVQLTPETGTAFMSAGANERGVYRLRFSAIP